jgi:hypothetical protein
MQLKTYANMVPQPFAICIPFKKNKNVDKVKSTTVMLKLLSLLLYSYTKLRGSKLPKPQLLTNSYQHMYTKKVF